MICVKMKAVSIDERALNVPDVLFNVTKFWQAYAIKATVLKTLNPPSIGIQ